VETARTKRHLRAVPPSPPTPTVARSTFIVMLATLGSTLLGFAREVVNARYYGTRWEMDTFLAAATIPTIVFGLFNGALVSALVPVFSEYIATKRDEEAWKLASTVLNGLLIVLSVAAVLGWLLAPLYVPLIAHGFPAPQMGVAIRMTRWLMPSIVATSLAGVLAAILNAHHRFGGAALQGIAINVVTIGVVVWLDAKLGIYALVLGTTLGLCAQLLVQLPSFVRLGSYRPTIDLRHPGLQMMWSRLGPIVVGSAAGQIALFFDRFFASTLVPGYIAAINYANKLVGFPQQIFAAAIATVIFPLLASHFARDNRKALRQGVTMGLRIVLFVTVPATCGLIALAGPIVQTLFERGSFTPLATANCAVLLPYAAFGLVPMAANVILTRVCFACAEMRWPVVISCLAVAINVVLSVIWLPSLAARGLLLANAVSQGAQTILLLVVAWRLLGGLNVKALARSFGATALCSIAMVMALEWIASLGAPPAQSFAGRAWALAGELAIGAAVFLAVARLVRAEELELTIGALWRKFAARVPSAAENTDAPIA
jgi:putative peptidoglycan lipid II flippase